MSYFALLGKNLVLSHCIQFIQETSSVINIFNIPFCSKLYGHLDVVKEFQGHGIGKEMHEDPGIPNYGKAGKGIRLEPGMTLAVEPMVIMGNNEIYQDEDGWTILTDDGSLSAHYENTILITEKEPEILTLV